MHYRVAAAGREWQISERAGNAEILAEGSASAPRLAGRRGDRDGTGLSRWPGASRHPAGRHCSKPNGVSIRWQTSTPSPSSCGTRTWSAGPGETRNLGRLSDWFYADNVRLNLNIVGMAPNGAALHSDQNRSIFGADELFYVLEGKMVQANPVTGEVLVIRPGEAAFFRKDTWHHQWNYSNHQLRMLEFFQPSPKTGTGGRYARDQGEHRPAVPARPRRSAGPLADGARPSRGANRPCGSSATTTILWRLEGGVRGRELLVGILASTEHMTVGKIEFLGGQRSCEFTHQGDKVIFVEEGNLHIEFPDTRQWVELDAWDGCRIPEGTRHSFYNMSHERRAACSPSRRTTSPGASDERAEGQLGRVGGRSGRARIPGTRILVSGAPAARARSRGVRRRASR